jgi:hypothetical protein
LARRQLRLPPLSLLEEELPTLTDSPRRLELLGTLDLMVDIPSMLTARRFLPGGSLPTGELSLSWSPRELR